TTVAVESARAAWHEALPAEEARLIGHDEAELDDQLSRTPRHALEGNADAEIRNREGVCGGRGVDRLDRLAVYGHLIVDRPADQSKVRVAQAGRAVLLVDGHMDDRPLRHLDIGGGQIRNPVRLGSCADRADGGGG